MAPARMRAELDMTAAAAPDLRVRLRACASTHPLPISDVARALLDRWLVLSADGTWTWAHRPDSG